MFITSIIYFLADRSMNYEWYVHHHYFTVIYVGIYTLITTAHTHTHTHTTQNTDTQYIFRLFTSLWIFFSGDQFSSEGKDGRRSVGLQNTTLSAAPQPSTMQISSALGTHNASPQRGFNFYLACLFSSLPT